MIRRARLQLKPNVAKAAKMLKKDEKGDQLVGEVQMETEKGIDGLGNEQRHEERLMNDLNNDEEPPPLEDMPKSTENDNSFQSIEQRIQMEVENRTVDVEDKPIQHHVHFDDTACSSREVHSPLEPLNVSHDTSGSSLMSPTSQQRFIPPRSRNVSQCEDESILSKVPKEKKRFTGREELDTRTWKMSDLTRWNPCHEKAIYRRERRSSTSSTIRTKSEAHEPSGGTNVAPINAPQVKIGADGKLVIDEASLVAHTASVNQESVWENVEEGRFGNNITSLSFRNRIHRKSASWSEKETELFYLVLQCTGSDFGLMHHYLPQRSRHELKAKYNREEKFAWQRVKQVISQPVTLDEKLNERIEKKMKEIENDVREKKEKVLWEKEEERRVRQDLREQKMFTRREEQAKKEEAKELVRKAKQMEKEVKASKRVEKEAEKHQKVQERLNKLVREKERREMDKMAKRIAKKRIEDWRSIDDKMKRDEEKLLAQEFDYLEKQAEKIIKRLVFESKREEKRISQNFDKPSSERKRKKKNDSCVEGNEPSNEDDLVGYGWESSSSSPASDSDEEAVRKDTARRERARMTGARRELAMRSSKMTATPKYARKEPKFQRDLFAKTIEVAKSGGGVFNSADEDDEIREHSEDSNESGDDVEKESSEQSVTPVSTFQGEVLIKDPNLKNIEIGEEIIDRNDVSKVIDGEPAQKKLKTESGSAPEKSSESKGEMNGCVERSSSNVPQKTTESSSMKSSLPGILNKPRLNKRMMKKPIITAKNVMKNT